MILVLIVQFINSGLPLAACPEGSVLSCNLLIEDLLERASTDRRSRRSPPDNQPRSHAYALEARPADACQSGQLPARPLHGGLFADTLEMQTDTYPAWQMNFKALQWIADPQVQYEL